MLSGEVSEGLAIGDKFLNKKAAEFFALAAVFRKDADDLGERQTIPQYYLYSHAFELALKAYLVDQGPTEKQLFNIGRKLTDFFNQAQQCTWEYHASISQFCWKCSIGTFIAKIILDITLFMTDSRLSQTYNE